ncbi:WXG100-like domain-containing protein [Streptomyces cacaoi]
MSLQISEEGRTAFAVLTGSPFPSGDEDGLRALGRVYADMRRRLEEMPDLAAHVTRAVRERFSMRAADRFEASLAEFTGPGNYLEAGAEAARGLERLALTTATNVEYAKYMAIAQLAEMFAEIALAIATFRYPLIPEIQLNTSLFLQRLLNGLVQHVLASVVISEGVALSMDALIQRIQIDQGTRDEWDKESTKQAALGGLVDGLIAGPTGLLAHAGTDKLLRHFGNSAGDAVAKDVAGQAAAAALPEGVTAGLSSGVRDLVREHSGDLLRPLGGREAGQGLGDEAAHRLSDAFGSVFADALPPLLGTGPARALGRDYGSALARHWGTDGGQEAVRAAVREVLDGPTGSRLPQPLRETLEQLPGTLHQGLLGTHDKIVERGAQFLGTTAAYTGQGYLSEGLYNLLFSDQHTFEVSPWSGPANAVAGHATEQLGAAGTRLVSSLTADSSSAGPSPAGDAPDTASSSPETGTPGASLASSPAPFSDSPVGGSAGTPPATVATGPQNGSGQGHMQGASVDNRTAPHTAQQPGTGGSPQPEPALEPEPGDDTAPAEPDAPATAQDAQLAPSSPSSPVPHTDSAPDAATSATGASATTAATAAAAQTAAAPGSPSSRPTGPGPGRAAESSPARAGTQPSTEPEPQPNAQPSQTTSQPSPTVQAPHTTAQPVPQPPTQPVTPLASTDTSGADPAPETARPGTASPGPVPSTEQGPSAPESTDAHHPQPGPGTPQLNEQQTSGPGPEPIPTATDGPTETGTQQDSAVPRDAGNDTGGGSRGGAGQQPSGSRAPSDSSPGREPEPDPEGSANSADSTGGSGGDRRDDGSGNGDGGDRGGDGGGRRPPAGDDREASEDDRPATDDEDSDREQEESEREQSDGEETGDAESDAARGTDDASRRASLDVPPQQDAQPGAPEQEARDGAHVPQQPGQQQPQTADGYALGQYGRIERLGDLHLGPGSGAAQARRASETLRQLSESYLRSRRAAAARRNGQRDERDAEEQPPDPDLVARLALAIQRRLAGAHHRDMLDGGLSLQVDDPQLGRLDLLLEVGEVSRARTHDITAEVPQRPGAVVRGEREPVTNRMHGGGDIMTNTRTFSVGTSHGTGATPGGGAGPTVTGTSTATAGQTHLLNTYARPELGVSGRTTWLRTDNVQLTIRTENGRGVGEVRTSLTTVLPTELTTTFPTEPAGPAGPGDGAPQRNEQWETWDARGQHAAQNGFADALLHHFALVQQSHGQGRLRRQLIDRNSLLLAPGTEARGFVDDRLSEEGFLATFRRMLGSDRTGLLLPVLRNGGERYVSEARATVQRVRRLGDAEPVTLSLNTRSWASANHVTGGGGGRQLSLGGTVTPHEVFSLPVTLTLSDSVSHKNTVGYTGGFSRTSGFSGRSVPYLLSTEVSVALRREGDPSRSVDQRVDVVVRVPEELVEDFEARLNETDPARAAQQNAVEEPHQAGQEQQAPEQQQAQPGRQRQPRRQQDDEPAAHRLDEQDDPTAGPGEEAHELQQLAPGQQLGREQPAHEAPQQPDPQEPAGILTRPTGGSFLLAPAGLSGVRDVVGTFLDRGARLLDRRGLLGMGTWAQRDLREFLDARFHAEELLHQTEELFSPQGLSYSYRSGRGAGEKQITLRFRLRGERLPLAEGGAITPLSRHRVEAGSVQWWPTHWAWSQSDTRHSSAQGITLGPTVSQDAGGVTVTVPEATFGYTRSGSRNQTLTSYGFTHSGLSYSGPLWHETYAARFHLSVSVVDDNRRPFEPEPVPGRVSYLVPADSPPLPEPQPRPAGGTRRVEPVPLANGTLRFPLHSPAVGQQMQLSANDRVMGLHHTDAVRDEALRLLHELGVARSDAAPFVETALSDGQLFALFNRDSHTTVLRHVVSGTLTDRRVHLVVQAMPHRARPAAPGGGQAPRLQRAHFTLDEYLTRRTGTVSTTHSGSAGASVGGSGEGDAAGGALSFGGTRAHGRSSGLVEMLDTHPGAFVQFDLAHTLTTADVTWQINAVTVRGNVLRNWSPTGRGVSFELPGSLTMLRPDDLPEVAPALVSVPLQLTAADPAHRRHDGPPPALPDQPHRAAHPLLPLHSMPMALELDPGQRDAPETVRDSYETREILAEVTRLLERYASGLLSPARGTPAPGTLTRSGADLSLDMRVLRILNSALRGPGVAIRMRTDHPGHHHYVHLVVRLLRGEWPGNDAPQPARFSGHRVQGTFSRYEQANQRREATGSSSDTTTWNLSGSVTGPLVDAATTFTPSISRARTTSSADNASRIVRRHSALTTQEEDLYPYRLPATLELRLATTAHPSQILNSVLLDVPRRLLRLLEERGGARRLRMWETVLVPRSELLTIPPPGRVPEQQPQARGDAEPQARARAQAEAQQQTEAQQQAERQPQGQGQPQGRGQAPAEAEAQQQRRDWEVPAGLFRDQHALADISDEAGGLLFDGVLDALRRAPGAPSDFGRPGENTVEELRRALDARVLADQLRQNGLTDRDGPFTPYGPELATEGGLMSPTYGRLEIRFRAQRPEDGAGWQKKSAESAHYAYRNNTSSLGDSRSLTISGKLGFKSVDGATHSPAVAAGSTSAQAAEADAGGWSAIRGDSQDVTSYWLRYSPVDLSVDIRLTGWSGSGRTRRMETRFERTVDLPSALQLRFSPEVLLSGVGGLEAEALRVESGWYVPAGRADDADGQEGPEAERLREAQRRERVAGFELWHLTSGGGGSVQVRGEPGPLTRQEFLERFVLPGWDGQQAPPEQDLVWETADDDRPGDPLLLRTPTPPHVATALDPHPEPPTPPGENRPGRADAPHNGQEDGPGAGPPGGRPDAEQRDAGQHDAEQQNEEQQDRPPEGDAPPQPRPGRPPSGAPEADDPVPDALSGSGGPPAAGPPGNAPATAAPADRGVAGNGAGPASGSSAGSSRWMAALNPTARNATPDDEPEPEQQP